MADWQTGYVTANGLRLHYTRTGGDKPPVVMAHGVTDAGPCWTRVAEALAPDYDAIMLDARGHGRSDAPERGYGSAEQAEDLAGAIAALGLHHPAVLGHSMGAASTLVMAGTHPDVPGAILLEDPPPWWMGAAGREADRERAIAMRTRYLGLKRKTREELLAGQRAEQPGWSDAELEPWAEAKMRFSPDVLSLFTPGTSAPVDWPAILRRITCPALLITADPAQGAIVSPEDAAGLRELIPHLEVARIPNAGHSIRRDQFAPYINVVRSFLAQHWQGAAV